MVRKQKKRTEKINYEKILPPRAKDMTRVGEMEAVRRLGEQMKNTPFSMRPPIPSKKKF